VAVESARRGRRRPTLDEGPAVTREQITAAAYHIARTEGLNAIQIRRVASELGVWPQTIYYYIPSKSALLELVADRALATRRPASVHLDAPWDERLLDLFRRITDVFAQHPGLAEFVVTRPDFSWSEHVTAIADEALSALFEGGLTPAEALAAFGSLASLIFGEIQLQRTLGTTRAGSPQRINQERFPAVARTQAELQSPRAGWPSGAETFIAGLAKIHESPRSVRSKVLLSGRSRSLSPQPATSRPVPQLAGRRTPPGRALVSSPPSCTTAPSTIVYR
jgi:AcrR family transcriptional regulator